MKKRRVLLLTIFAIFALMIAVPTMDVQAKDCSSYTTKTKCKKHANCSWDKKSKSCSEKANGGSSTTNVSNSKLSFCKRTAKIWKIVGSLFFAVKILVPVILIVMGSIDFGKAVVSSKEDEIKKAAKTLGLRAASGLIIFFIPTIVTILMGLIANFSSSGAASDYKTCKTCIMTPSKCDTSNDASN